MSEALVPDTQVYFSELPLQHVLSNPRRASKCKLGIEVQGDVTRFLVDFASQTQFLHAIDNLRFGFRLALIRGTIEARRSNCRVEVVHEPCCSHLAGAIEGWTRNDRRQRGIVECYVGVHTWSRCQVPCTSLAVHATVGNLSAPSESSFHGVSRTYWTGSLERLRLPQVFGLNDECSRR